MINKLLMSIFNLTLQINDQQNHEVFIDLAPHVSQISVRIFKGGWVEGKEIDLSLDSYYDRMDSEKELTKINNILLQYIKL